MSPPLPQDARGDAPDSFLGRGWGFPPTFARQDGSVRMVQGVRDIEESLALLLSTVPGERVMRPDYGCDVRRLLFEPLDASVTAYVEDLVRTAILYHEPRIRLESLALLPAPEEGRMDVVLTYVVRATNSRHNHVFPFYREEGTELRR